MRTGFQFSDSSGKFLCILSNLPNYLEYIPYTQNSMLMKLYRRLLFFTLIIFLAPMFGLSQESTNQNEESSKSSPLRKIASGSGEVDLNVHINEIMLEENIEMSIENAMKTVDVVLENLDLQIDPIAIDLADLNIEIEPVEINIPSIDIEIEPVEVDLDDLDIDVDIDDEDFFYHDDDQDSTEDEELKPIDHHKNKDKNKDELKDKSGKEKDKSDKEKSKGLKKLN